MNTVMGYGYHGMSGWGYALMTVSTLALVALLVVGIVLLARYASTSAQAPERPESRSAEDLLGERFARGDIDADEYRGRLETLRGGSS